MTKLVSVIAREEAEGWWVWSPQCPELVAGEETEAELLRSLPGTIAWYFEDDQHPGHQLPRLSLRDAPGPRIPSDPGPRIDDEIEIRLHVEREVGGVFVRVARDGQQAARQEAAGRVAAALADPDLAGLLREAPSNQFGEVTYICALPTDTRGWLEHQIEERRGPVNVVVPLSGTTLWVRAFGGWLSRVPGRAGEPLLPAAPGEATGASDRQRILVPA